MRQGFEDEVLGTGSPPTRRKVVATLVATAAVALVAGLAGSVDGARAGQPVVATDLVQAATAQPDQMFDVIVQGKRDERSDKLVKRIANRLAKAQGIKGKDKKVWFEGLKDQFDSINGIAVTVSGKELQKLLKESGVEAVSLDAEVQLDALDNTQKWDEAVRAKWYWGSSAFRNTAATMPAIAVVDSGIAARPEFGSRLVASVNLATALPNSPGDGYGHGTMVAGLAAGASSNRSGANPGARLVSVDVVNDDGMANTSDVIRACDWILANKDAYNIKVANFSLSSSRTSSFRWDPLDKAVERLWFAGITVVASAGNYGTGATPSGVVGAPANDPFVITVGAVDVRGTSGTGDDEPAPWTAWGYTADGFAKPDLSAPGRYMIGTVPGNSTLSRKGGQDPRLVPSGYLQLSGTSFAAPVVAGLAAAIAAAKPDWGPDQIKGALMLSATAVKGNTGQLGVGEVNLENALKLASPPNPNEALNQFVVPDPAGGAYPLFDEETWAATAAASASWASASWASASWASASWASASWASASWSSASWASLSSASGSQVNYAVADASGEG